MPDLLNPKIWGLEAQQSVFSQNVKENSWAPELSLLASNSLPKKYDAEVNSGPTQAKHKKTRVILSACDTSRRRGSSHIRYSTHYSYSPLLITNCF